MSSSRQVGVFDSPAFTKTSYASEFEVPKRQPTHRFHNYVSFVSDTEDKLVSRCFPHFALHVSPHRILDYERSALCFEPTGAEYVEADQAERGDAGETEADESDSQSRNLQDEVPINSENMAPRQKIEIPKHVLDEVTANIYKSTAKRASEECALPVRARPAVLPCIIGRNEERELYHSVYRRTGSWKTNVVPEIWERAQERPLYEDPKAKQYRPMRLKFCKSKTRLLGKRSQNCRKSCEKALRPLIRVEGSESLPTAIQHIRPPAGYAGFVPKLPLIPRPARDPRLMLPTSAATHRNVFSEDLGTPEHAYKGPLSKLVTTTTPCNPFNKLTQLSQLTSGLFVI